MIAGVISIAIAVVIVLNRAAVRTPAIGQQVARTNTSAVITTPKTKSEHVKVELTGITTILNVKRALLRVQWPAETSTRDYILSEGQSKDSITVDSIDVPDRSVTLRVLQVTRTVRVEKGA